MSLAGDLATVGRIETASLATWPALTERRDGSWVMRRSEGHTGRANSITILDPNDDGDRPRRLAAAEDYYRAAGLEPLLRQTPLTPRSLAGDLAAAGWSDADGRGETSVMWCQLAETPALSADVERLETASAEWLMAAGALMGFSSARRDAIGRKLAGLSAPAAFFMRRDETGAVIATALSVVAVGMLAIYDVAVAPGHRRQGHAHMLAAAAFDWGRKVGADAAFLQVVAANDPAVALYRGLGFAEAYRYRYLAPPVGEGAP